MDDPVLMSRLAALSHNLKLVSSNLESNAWKSGEADSTRREELGRESLLWDGLAATLKLEINQLLIRIGKVETKLLAAAPDDMAAASAAWVEYSKILLTSQDLLRECLEIIGTLAIRQKNLDHKSLFIADELMRDCLRLSTGGTEYYLLVHGMGDALFKTRARIIRLRFPDWTIWDLPLAMHELGNVVMTIILAREREHAREYPDEPELQVLTPYRDKQRDSLVATDPQLSQKFQAGGDGAAEATRWAEGRVRVLLADAFATYTMGPAYAYSAITLRLSPTASAQRDVPSDAQRAQTILSMLAWMNENTGPGDVTRPYTEEIDRLGRSWADACSRCTATGRLGDKEAEYLRRFAFSFGSDVSGGSLSPSAMYPTGIANQGWKCAADWAGAWLRQWKEKPGAELSCPDNPTGLLRDVLNAAWLCRARINQRPDMASSAHNAIASVGQKLCIEIVSAKSKPRTPEPSSAAPAGGAK
jgi:hypothetical protein